MSISTPAITNFTAGEISPRLDGRVDIAKYFNGCQRLDNFHVHAHGGATRRSGFRFVTEALSQDKETLLIPFEFNATQTYVLELGEDENGQGKLRVISDHGVVMSGEAEYIRDIPYTAAQFERLRYAQSADVLILVHPAHPPRKLTRLNHDDWKLEDLEFTGKPEAWKENNYPSSVCFYEQRLVLAATPDKPGTLWFSRTDEITDFRLKTREAPLDQWRDREIKDPVEGGLREGKAEDTFTLFNGDGFEKKDAVKGQHPDGTTRYYRYKGEKNYSACGSNITLTFKEAPGNNELERIWDDADKLNEEFWDCYALGDRVEAAAGDKPLSDDAIEVTLSGREANGIEFMVPRARLWLGTAGGEWTITGNSGDPVTPESIKANHEGTSGAASARPEAVGFATIYIQRAGKKIREMSYRFESDAYVSKDLTILSEHIAGPGLSQMAYVQEPYSIIYCTRTDGKLAAMTYAPEQEVAAWGHMSTQGHVHNVTSIYSDTTKRDELWIAVTRTINGKPRKYIEYLETMFDGAIENGFFVDSGLTYEGPPTTTVQGLGHLAGETVTVLADGAVQSDKKVDLNGTLTLDRMASKIHAGLPYTSILQPMRVEAGSHNGTSQTKRKRITKVATRFFQTLGGKIGPTPTRLEPVYFRSPSTPMGSSPGAWSGDKCVNFPKGWESDATLTIVQDQPLPMSVLLIVPKIIINE